MRCWNWLFILLGFLIISGGIYVVHRSSRAGPIPLNHTPSSRNIRLLLAGGKLTPPEVSVPLGTQINCLVTSRDAGELHLHPYKIELKVRPGLVSRFTFLADKAGRFEWEFHKSETEEGIAGILIVIPNGKYSPSP